MGWAGSDDKCFPSGPTEGALTIVVLAHSHGEDISSVIPSYRFDVPEEDLEGDAHSEHEHVLTPELLTFPSPLPKCGVSGMHHHFWSLRSWTPGVYLFYARKS